MQIYELPFLVVLAECFLIIGEGITLSQLPKVTTMAANDLIEIDRNGTGAAVSYANLVEAMTDSLGLAGVAEALEQIIG